MKYHLLHLSSVTWSLTNFSQSQLCSQKQCPGLLQAFITPRSGSWEKGLEGSSISLLSVGYQGEADLRPRGRASKASCLFQCLPPLPRVARWTARGNSCAGKAVPALIWVHICLLQAGVVLKWIFALFLTSSALTWTEESPHWQDKDFTGVPVPS